VQAYRSGRQRQQRAIEIDIALAPRAVGAGRGRNDADPVGRATWEQLDPLDNFRGIVGDVVRARNGLAVDRQGGFVVAIILRDIVDRLADRSGAVSVDIVARIRALDGKVLQRRDDGALSDDDDGRGVAVARMVRFIRRLGGGGQGGAREKRGEQGGAVYHRKAWQSRPPVANRARTAVRCALGCARLRGIADLEGRR
jgi:hypothetical protein